MSARTIALIVFLALTLIPIGWNKFDIVRHAYLLYGLGILLPLMAIFSFKKFQHIHVFSRDFLILIVFFALVVASFYTSTIQNYGWSEVLVTGSGIMLYFMAKTFGEKERKFFAATLTVLALISVVIAAYLYLTTSETRVAGLFFDYDKKAHIWPNAFALFLLMVWPVALQATMQATRFFQKKYIKIIILSILFTALFLTFSRAAMITFFIQVAVFFFINKNSVTTDIFQKKYTAVIGIILLTGILIFSFQQVRSLKFEINSFQKKIAFQGTERETSIQERADFMKGAATLAMEKPFLGYGPGTFRFVYPKIQQNFLATSDHPHNFFLKIWMENGTFALITFLIFLFIIGWHQIKNPSLYSIAALGALTQSLVDYNLNFLTNALLFWIILGFSTDSSEGAKKNPSKTIAALSIFIVLGSLTVLLSLSAISEGFLAGKLRYAQDPQFYKSSRFPRDFWANRNTEKDLKYHLKLNSLDAFAWHTLGILQEKNQRWRDAYQSYKRGIQANPANFFNFYFNYFRVARSKNIKDPEQENIRKNALKFLTSYPDKVRKNIHYTAQTGNIDAAQKLAEILNELELAEKIKEAHIEWIRKKTQMAKSLQQSVQFSKFP